MAVSLLCFAQLRGTGLTTPQHTRNEPLLQLEAGAAYSCFQSSVPTGWHDTRLSREADHMTSPSREQCRKVLMHLCSGSCSSWPLSTLQGQLLASLVGAFKLLRELL